MKQYQDDRNPQRGAGVFSRMTNRFFRMTALCCWTLCAALGALAPLSARGVMEAPRARWEGVGRPDEQVPFMETVRSGALPSGLRYFILENKLPAGRASLTLAVRAGSVLETDAQRGLAHFVEHIAFNGTERFPKLSLIEYLRSLGMRFGADANAYTSYDQTVYGIEVPTEEVDGIRLIPDKALAILDDWTRALSFDPGEVDKERLVIMEEYRSRLGAMQRARKEMFPLLFAGSPYAAREPIGLPEVIEQAGAADLRAFYERWYRADNMALIFVGDFDGAALEASLARHFRIPAPEAPAARPEYPLPPPQKGRFAFKAITDAELTTTTFSFYYKKAPAAARGTLAAYRADIVDYLVSTMMALRFDDAATKPQTPFTAAWAAPWDFGRAGSFYCLGVDAKTGRAEEALRALLLEKERALRYGFASAELAQAKQSLIASLERLASEQDRRESSYWVRHLTSYYIDDETLPSLEWELAAAKQLLAGLSLAETQRAFERVFNDDDCVVFALAPQSEAEALPSRERIAALASEAREAAKGSAPALAGREAPAQGAAQGAAGALPLAEAPAPGVISAEETDAETGAQIWRLGNGAHVILKKTENRNNEVILYALARGGTSSAGAPDALDTDAVSAALAPELLSASGLGPYTRTELVRRLAGVNAAFSFFASRYYRGFEGSATVKDLGALFQMLFLNFTSPTIRPDAAEALLDQYRTSLALALEDPQEVFTRAIARERYAGHPRFQPLEAADLEKVSFERALAFIKKGLNPADYTFVLTGNIDMDALRPLVSTWIASIPRAAPWDEWTELPCEKPAAADRTVRKGQEERAMVFMAWSGDAPYSEEQSQSAALLSEYLEIGLTEEIREKRGGVYGISPWAQTTNIPKGERNLSIYFQCDPARADELCAAVEAELRALAQGPVDEDRFLKARAALLKEYEKNTQSNRYLAESFANSAVLFKSPLARLTRRPALIAALTQEDVQSLCARLLEGKSLRVRLFPETNVETTPKS
ncbi:MAG: insulinase family protein [Treponema sp.]|jgi:zinc protease|nr:insulinase family protein [Treponema sp.]